MHRKLPLIVATVAFAATFTSLTQAEIRYNVISLRQLQQDCYAWAINNNGQIAGQDHGQAALWTYTEGQVHRKQIGPSPGLYTSKARAINSIGQIVGSVSPIPNYMQPGGGAAIFDTVEVAGCKIIGFLGSAYSINDSGIIVGNSWYSDVQGIAPTMWQIDETGQYSSTRLAQNSGEGWSINNNGQIVGSVYRPANCPADAMIFDPARNLASWTPGGLGDAYSINNLGQIVGRSADYKGEYHPVIFTVDGLSCISLAEQGAAYSINNLGQVVGHVNGVATLFDPTGHGNNINLNTLIDPASGWRLNEATAINDNGWIVGNGEQGAFLLVPIPEPTMLLLLGLGGVMLRSKKS
jgi:uncharacterized membrane protein